MLLNKHYYCQCVGCNLEQEVLNSNDNCPKCNDILKVVAKYGTCTCGQEVEFSGFTNTCECGADYNWSGDRLAPRSQWGEETGEHWSDIGPFIDSERGRYDFESGP